MGVDVAFWIFAVLGVMAALGVVLVKNMFRAALLLVLCFFTVAGIYGSLAADFLAIVQVLVYMGAISVLIIFAVMLTRDVRRGNPFNRDWPAALVICGCLMAVLIYVAIDTTWPEITPVALPEGASPDQAVNLVEEGKATTGKIASAIFDDDHGFLLPLEIGGMLILAAVIGAIALVKEKD